MKLHSIVVGVVGLSVIGLAAGCASSKGDIQEIAYEGTTNPKTNDATNDTPIVPKETDTVPEGSADEVITPTGPVAVADEYVASPAVPEPTAPAPSVEPVGGDAVAEGDTVPDIGEPPVLPAPVNCDEPAFAFVSSRGGRENVYRSAGGRVEAVTANDHDFRYYKNLAIKPGSKTLSYSELAILHPLIPIPALSVFTGDVDGGAFTKLESGGAFAKGLAWNADGSKGAYFAQRVERGKVLTDLHMFDARTGAAIRTLSIDRSGNQVLGNLAWWGDYVVYDRRYADYDDTTKELYIADSRPTGSSSYPLYVKDEGIVFHRYLGSDPAVSRTGDVLVYVQKMRGVDTLMACALRDREQIFGGIDGFLCRGAHALTTAGAIDDTAFSPDGRWIYFVSDRHGNREIHRIRADGTGEERLTNDAASDASPAPFAPSAGCE